MISIVFFSLPSFGGVEAVQLVEPVVEEAQVNKQMLAYANKLMTDARINGMKAVASCVCLFGRPRSRWAPYCFRKSVRTVKLVKVWSVSGGKEVVSLAGHTARAVSLAGHTARAVSSQRLFGRLQP